MEKRYNCNHYKRIDHYYYVYLPDGKILHLKSRKQLQDIVDHDITLTGYHFVNWHGTYYLRATVSHNSRCLYQAMPAISQLYPVMKYS